MFLLFTLEALQHISTGRIIITFLEKKTPMFAFLIIWIHLKQKKHLNLRCFNLLEKRYIEGRTWVSDVSILTEESGFVPRFVTRRRWEGKGGAKTALMGNREFRKDPKRLSWRRKLWETSGMCTIISPFSTVCRFNEGGAKSLKGQDNRKGYSFQLQTKPALCVDIVYTYQYIDICRASYLYIPFTYIVYGTKVL